GRLALVDPLADVEAEPSEEDRRLPVERLADAEGARLGALDDGHAAALAREARGEREPADAAARDDDVVLRRVPRLRLRPAPPARSDALRFRRPPISLRRLRPPNVAAG